MQKTAETTLFFQRLKRYLFLYSFIGDGRCCGALKENAVITVITVISLNNISPFSQSIQPTSDIMKAIFSNGQLKAVAAFK